MCLCQLGVTCFDLEFDQILDLVRQLPKKEKIRLSKELEREIINAKLTSLLKAFRTDSLDQETINNEVETELYAKSKAKYKHKTLCVMPSDSFTN